MSAPANQQFTEELVPEASVQLTAEELRRLHHAWGREPSWYGWLTSTDHKEIGLRFVGTALFFFVLAGILALLIRIQLAFPQNNFIGPDLYNQLFTTHGTAMMFIFAVPVMEGMGLYFVPLMVGTRNVSFPRLLNYSYYMYLGAAVVLFGSLILNIGPDMGWFSYVPLAGPAYTPGRRYDLWSVVVTCSEISAICGGVEIITTVFKQRAPGMSLPRIPLFVWAQLITAGMIIFAMPSVMLCSTMLSMDRLANVNTHFFNPAEGGDAILWQHLFWFFAHPEVYIIFIPATGFVSTILPTFCRHRAFGYTPLVLSMVATAFIGFGVWVHHMFATPLPRLGQGLFTASSLMIVIPNAVQMYCWLALLWLGRPRLELPMMFVLGFFAIFIMGGLTGVMLASVAIDLQVHDTMFVVAHLHYVLIGGSVFPLFGAFYYWFPKWTGRMLDGTLGWINWTLMFVGFNLTFFPLHQLGLQGMPRRVYTYLPDNRWAALNQMATVGAFLIALSVLVFLINVFWSYRRGRVAGDNPWMASTLEWAAASPPPPYNFVFPPIVSSRDPLWDDDLETPAIVTGLSLDEREVLVTTAQDATPDHLYRMDRGSIWPFLTAVATTGEMIGLVYHAMAQVIGSIILFALLVGWFWPSVQSRPVYYQKEPRKDRPKDLQGPSAAKQGCRP